MARLIKTTTDVKLYVIIQTVFEDGSTQDKVITTGDIIENLRYVSGSEVITVSGKVINIEYSTVSSKFKIDRNDPKDTLATGIILNNLILDASTEFNSNIISVPFNEIVEDDGVENVERMRTFASAAFELTLKYSNGTEQTINIAQRDTFNKVKIMGVNPGDEDITGEFEVKALSYKITSTGNIAVDQVVFSDGEENIFVDVNKIISLNEIYTYPIESVDDFATIVTALASGDTITLGADLDATNGLIAIDGKDIKFNLEGNTFTAGSSSASGLCVTNGTVTLSNGTFKTNSDYDSNHSTGVATVGAGGALILNDINLSAVRPDAVNKGQFGFVTKDDGKIIFNDGHLEAGWCVISGNDAKTNGNASVEINGGEVISTVDYAIYHPYPGTLIVNDGIIRGGAGAISANNGTVIINGGTITSLGDDTGTWVDGTSDQSFAAINVNAKYGNTKLIITGGTIIANDDAVTIATGTRYEAIVEISGGFFSSAVPEEWIKEGYACSEEPNSDGLYYVYKKTI